MTEIPKILASGFSLEDFVINTLCKPDKVLVGLDYNPYEKVWVAKYLFLEVKKKVPTYVKKKKRYDYRKTGG